MQGKHLWAALFLLPLLAHADVTLYGTLDETIESVGTRGAANGQPGNSVRRISSDSSLIGFKGREELGKGLSAYWQLESNLWLDSAPSYATFGTRDSFVGLATPAGNVQAGLISPPTRVVAGMLDVNQGNTGIGMSGALLGKLGNILSTDGLLKSYGSATPADGNGNTLVRTSPFDTRRKNAVQYTSPSWQGLTATVGYDTVETRATGASHAASVFDLGLSYRGGPWLLTSAYERIDTGVDDAASSTTQFRQVWNLRAGGYYRFGEVSRIGLLFDHTDGHLTPTAAASYQGSSLSQNVWYAQAVIGVGDHGRLISQYGASGKLQGSTVSDSGRARHAELGYEYDLSRHSTLKALYAQIWNHGSAAYDFGFSSIGTVPAGSTVHGLAMGLRHSF
ncbi:outer membrane protein [Aquitalea magnusonii]|uniref:Outer membrane protein n=1 Tax=Aquitalea magnusonii TaxID=332411 RepID=A0A3G9G8C6_9NEIS|nr:porin [Aquitalea magnusonii]BBF84260.1 outer membrane protein [Aquitalea magnusonii]